MRLIALGRTDDTRGFALAGVETVRGETPHEASAQLARLVADATVGLVIVPAWLERAAPASIARERARQRAAVVLVLPEADPNL